MSRRQDRRDGVIGTFLMGTAALRSTRTAGLRSTRHPLRGWRRRSWDLVGSFKLQVSFAKEPYKRDDIPQKRPIIFRTIERRFVARWWNNQNSERNGRVAEYSLSARWQSYIWKSKLTINVRLKSIYLLGFQNPARWPFCTIHFSQLSIELTFLKSCPGAHVKIQRDSHFTQSIINWVASWLLRNP